MKQIKIPVYNQEVFICNNYDDPDKYAIVEATPLTLRYNKESWCLSIMVHECVHIVDFLLANVGQGMPAKDAQGYYDDEFYSYLFATVFDMIFNKTKNDLADFKPKKKRRKKIDKEH